LDGSAYVSEELWSQIMDENHFELNIRDKRYDAVIHMVTAAEGAEEFYDYANEARYENIEEARDRDRRLRDAYLGHCRYFVVDNNHKNFGQKLAKTTELVMSVLGLPTSPYTFKKFLVDRSSLPEEMPVPMEHSYFNEYFLPEHTTIDDVSLD